MSDYAHEWTDGQIDELTKRFERVYSQAAREMRQKLEDRLEEHEQAKAAWKDRVRKGDATKEDYDGWLKSQAASHSLVNGIADSLAIDAAAADRLARDYINDAIPQVYAENANYAAYGIESAIGYDTHSFDLYDQSTVRRLIGMSEHDQTIKEVIPVGPPRPDLQSLRVDLAAAKDVQWNRQKFTSVITQSILQGESIPNTAKRLMTVLNMDRNMATRAARTAMTSAENAGRVDSYKRAERIGIKLEQQWMATLDERTRYSHRELDKQHVPVGKKFKVPSNGHELRFPADPMAHPSEVWNCRCTLVAWSPEMEAEDANVKRFSRLPEGMTYEEWKEGKKAEQQPKGKSIGELETILREREKELDEAASVRKPSRVMVDSVKRFADEYKARMDELSWTRELDAKSIQRESMEVENRLYEVNEKLYGDGRRRGKTIEERRAIREQRRALGEEYDRLLKRQTELDEQLYAIKSYKRAERQFNAHNDEYKRLAAALKEETGAYEVAQRRIPALVKRKNEAIRALSEAQPFAPDVRTKLGHAYADAMERMIDEAGKRHPEIAEAYRMFSSKLKVAEGNLTDRGAFYSLSDKGIHINAELTARGNDYRRPYQITFHEFGHLIDNVSQYGDHFMGEGNGLEAAIKSDWAKFRNSMGREYGVTRDKNAFTIKKLMEEKESDPDGLIAYGDVSDIIEGCTKTSYPLGVGHGASYHKQEGATTGEFVAELFDSAMSNEKSYQQMRRIFPTATELVEGLTRELVS